MRIAFLGGSFDPVHLGHLYIAEVARRELGYDRVLLAPASRSPHKRERRYADGTSRLAMLELATADRDDFLVYDWEIRNGGVSFTIDTVHHLYEEYDFDGRLGLIIGDDLVEGLATWKSVDNLLALVDLIVMKRDAVRTETAPAHVAVDNARLPISASSIRSKVADGRAFRYLVPDSVYYYILENGLYASED